MAKSKNYLNVPYAEKDVAKALGARWDASAKKWYAPNTLDLACFAKWRIDATVSSASLTAGSPISSPLKNNRETNGIFTYSTIADFVAYSGDEPPWA